MSVVITSRWQSQRFPNKALAMINGKPMLQHVIDRCRMSKADDVIVATTVNSMPIIDYCADNKIKYYAHTDEDDILGRLWETARQFNLDKIVRVWGDSPLIIPEAINLCLAYIDKWEYVFASCFPDGMKASAIKRQTLESVLPVAEKEWFHKWAMDNLTTYNIEKIDLSVDNPEDLELISKLC
jgi:spore coat polysaccharide biosynthesis protein SpsF (cytidylyltransferase family)